MKFLMVNFSSDFINYEETEEFFDIDNKSHMIEICINARLFD